MSYKKLDGQYYEKLLIIFFNIRFFKRRGSKVDQQIEKYLMNRINKFQRADCLTM